MVYSDSNYYLASRIAAKAAGERLQDFLARELFLPLGFQGWAWAVCPYGHAMGATRPVYQSGRYAAIWAALPEKRNLSGKTPAFRTVGSKRHPKPSASYRNGALWTEFLAYRGRCCVSLRWDERADYLYLSQGQPSSRLAGSRSQRGMHPSVKLVV